ncbi:MAG TPA: phytanoyl-CoA dioxygenase family protein [Caulobacterales bacterium]|nr:phytanoyl-CoA dioxygenase family protein [Caulobacterales bacterium]
MPRKFEQIREVTNEEVDFFEEHGWVKLEGLFARPLADELFHHIKHVMDSRIKGEDGYVAQRAPEAKGELMVEYVASTNLRESDDWLEDLAVCRELGEASARLIKTRPLRLFADSVFHKPARGSGPAWFSGETPWHQDYPATPLDRANDLQIWVAAVEITPEMGCLQYLSGSHRLPPMGKATSYRHPDGSRCPKGAVEIYPWLLDKFKVSPAFHMQPGDALAHHSLTMHYSQENQSTTHDRWAWGSRRMDARICYNGAPNHRTDGRGLELDKPFDHPAFPIVIE